MGESAKSAPPWRFSESTAPEVQSGQFFRSLFSFSDAVGVFGARTLAIDSGKVRGYRARVAALWILAGVVLGLGCQDLDKVQYLTVLVIPLAG